MDEAPRWTTFAIASEDLSGPVLGRIDGGDPLSVGDAIGLRSPNGVKRFRVERILFLEQVWPDAWVNRLVLLEPV
ncbi:MAG: hypothetical protein ACRDJ9_35440 [Dehalococcoidia bacterium]